MQIAGSQILIFGGLIPKSASRNKQDNTFEFTDQGVEMSLTNQSLIFDVTVGSIKFGPDLATPTYFMSGGFMMTNLNQIFCLGNTIAPTLVPTVSEHPSVIEFGEQYHKKLIHTYNISE